MSEQPQQPAVEQEQSQPLVWRRRVIAIVVIVLVGAVLGRMALSGQEETGSPSKPGLATGFAAGGDSGTRVEREETLADKMQKVLPFITEAGMALLLGMILGIGARMAIKTIVLVVILGVVGIQFAIFKGLLKPEDAQFIGHLKDYVFHVPEGKEAADIAIKKAPSLGAGMIGFLMGLKKG
ncbi:MAG: hypothetical protein AAGD14_05605 [Planctomycetota bacterium]